MQDLNGLRAKAVFIDRDGVINKTFFRDGKSRAPSTLKDFEFLPGVHEAVQKLHNAGFVIVVVTNQPDVARGWHSRDDVDAINRFVLEQLKVLDLKVCFHDNHDNCYCRKPKPGMLIEAAENWSIDLTTSFMIGDRFSDIEAGRAAGCKTILIGDGEGDRRAEPDQVAQSLLAAAHLILGAPDTRQK